MTAALEAPPAAAVQPRRATRQFRIAHVLPWPAVGGTEHATVRIANAIGSDGFDNVAFCIPGAEPVTALLDAASVPWRTYDPPVPSYRHYVAFLHASRRLARQFREAGVDLVHCADVAAGYQAALAGWLAGVPVLCHVRNRFDEISRRDSSFLWPVDRFVFVSMDTWRRFGVKVRRSRGSVVYDGISLPAVHAAEAAAARRSVCEEFNLPSSAPLIGTLARVAEQKDFPSLIRAAALVHRTCPDARFLVVGDHSSEETYRRHYAELRPLLAQQGVADAFVFTGYRRDTSRFLQAFDLFVLSTHWEGLPLVLLEAMAYQKPVVATAVDGVPEAVDDGKTGLLYGHEDHEALGRHIVNLLGDPDRARELAAAARASVQERFSAARFASSLQALYAEALRL